jgi:hypothetical protein
MTQPVQSYAGSSHPEKPRSLDWEGQHYVVDAILNQWREPRGLGFRVHCSPGNFIFDLYYETEPDIWTIQPQGSITMQD